MVPAKIAQFLKTLKEPDFFNEKYEAVRDEIHDCLTETIKNGTEAIEVEIDMDLLVRVEAVLKSHGWTVEESLVLFLMWCITCPDAMNTWYASFVDTPPAVCLAQNETCADASGRSVRVSDGKRRVYPKLFERVVSRENVR